MFDPILLWKNLTHFLFKILSRHDKMEKTDLADIVPAQITVTGLQQCWTHTKNKAENSLLQAKMCIWERKSAYGKQKLLIEF